MVEEIKVIQGEPLTANDFQSFIELIAKYYKTYKEGLIVNYENYCEFSLHYPKDKAIVKHIIQSSAHYGIQIGLLGNDLMTCTEYKVQGGDPFYPKVKDFTLYPSKIAEYANERHRITKLKKYGWQIAGPVITAIVVSLATGYIGRVRDKADINSLSAKVTALEAAQPTTKP